MSKINKPLKLEGTENTRELGGYPTVDNRRTKNRVYLRSDGTNNLTDKDIIKLKDYGLSLVIDLRSKAEIEKFPSVFKNLEGVIYENVPMLDGLTSMVEIDKIPKSMYELYIGLLDNGKEDFYKIFKLILENDGLILFSCTAGKDRTGVLAMLILQLANVSDEIIVKDYGVSYGNLKKFVEKRKNYLIGTDIKIPMYFLESNEEDMKKTLETFHEKYTDAKEYLLEVGLTEEELDVLNDRFIE